MHKKTINEVQYHKVTFGDVNPPMQIALEPLIPHVHAPVRATGGDIASTS